MAEQRPHAAREHRHLPTGQVLVGRSREQSALDGALDRAARGVGGKLAIEGEAGSGKSRLVEYLLQRASGRDVVALFSSGDELDRETPLCALAGALEDPRFRAAQHDSTSLLEPGEYTDRGPRDTGFAAIEAFLDTLRRIATDTPPLVVVDDLHWADPLSLRVVRAVAQRAEEIPCGVVVALRPLPRRSELDPVLESFLLGGQRLRLAGLSEEDIVQFAVASAGSRPGPALRNLLLGTGGNPFFLAELLHLLQSSNSLLATPDGMVEAATTSVPSSLAETVRRQLRFLPEPTHDLLRTAAIIGNRFSVDSVGALVGAGPLAVTNLLRPAVTSGVVHDAADGSALEFKHHIVRDALLDEIPTAARASLHRHVAQILHDAGAPSTQVAEHLLLSAPTGTRLGPTLEAIRAAARDVAARSPGSAVSILERALPLSDDQSLTAELVADLLEPLVWSGRGERAIELGRAALASTPRPPPGCEARIRRGLGIAEYLLGHFAAAISELDGLAEVPGADLPEVRAWTAHLSLWGGNLARAESDLRVATARPEEPRVAVVAETTRCLLSTARLDIASALESGRRAVEAAASPEASIAYVQPHISYALPLLESDEAGRAAEILAEGRRHAEDAGHVCWLPHYNCAEALVQYQLGILPDAEARAQAALSYCHDTGGYETPAAFARSILALCAVHAGDMTKATQLVQDADEAVGRLGPQVGFDWVMLARATLLEATGNTAAALDALRDGWQAIAPIRNLAGYRFLAPPIARLARNEEAGSERQHEAELLAADVLETMSRAAQLNPSAVVVAAAQRCRAIWSLDLEAGIDAVAASSSSDLPLVTAGCVEDVAVVARQLHRLDLARKLFGEALDRYDALDAPRDAARVRAALRSLGVRRRPRTRSANNADPLGNLTPTEKRVVALAADGLSNREIADALFVSPRTVETHIQHAYDKLGVRTRVQLARAVSEQPRGPC